MYLDPVRLARQNEVVRRWATKAGGRGTFEAVTGFGKTTTAFQALKTLLEKRDDKEFDVHVVVPTIFLKKQWEEKEQEWNLGSRMKISVTVVNSYIKRNHKCDVLILDEIHRYTGDEFHKVFSVANYRWVLGLTATLPPEDYRRNLLTRRAPVFDRVGLKEAQDNKWIAPYKIYNLGIELSPEEMAAYRKIDASFGKFFGVFGGDFSFAMKCLNDAATREEHARSMGWDNTTVLNFARNWVRTMHERIKILHVSNSKIEAAASVIQKFPDAKAISFNQLVVGADALQEKLGPTCASIHSKMKGREIDGEYYPARVVKDKALQSFREGGQIRVLSTAKALDQGADFPDISLAVVVSGSSTLIQALQRWGRALRKNGDEVTRIVEIFAKNTQDERWMLKRQIEAPGESIIQVDSISQIL
jgi:superfamily II DNA or RNA helicase